VHFIVVCFHCSGAHYFVTSHFYVKVSSETFTKQDIFFTNHNATERVSLAVVLYSCIGGCIRKFPDWPPGARTANVSKGKRIFHYDPVRKLLDTPS
jgi:hypothetical protein